MRISDTNHPVTLNGFVLATAISARTSAIHGVNEWDMRQLRSVFVNDCGDEMALVFADGSSLYLSVNEQERERLACVFVLNRLEDLRSDLPAQTCRALTQDEIVCIAKARSDVFLRILVGITLLSALHMGFLHGVLPGLLVGITSLSMGSIVARLLRPGFYLNRAERRHLDSADKATKAS